MPEVCSKWYRYCACGTKFHIDETRKRYSRPCPNCGRQFEDRQFSRTHPQYR